MSDDSVDQNYPFIGSEVDRLKRIIKSLDDQKQSILRERNDAWCERDAAGEALRRVVDVRIAVDKENKVLQDKLEEAQARLLEMENWMCQTQQLLGSAPSTVCRKTGCQNCCWCEDMNCGDNTSPARQRIRVLEAENAELRAWKTVCLRYHEPVIPDSEQHICNNCNNVYDIGWPCCPKCSTKQEEEEASE